MNYLTVIKGARCVVEDEQVDIVVTDGIISHLAPAGDPLPELEGATVVDGTGCLILPGLFDLHAHLCQPGKESRERIATASRAALHGGITGVQAMPDTSPMLDNAAQIGSFVELCQELAEIDVVPAGCITKNGDGVEQASYDSMRGKGVRCVTDADRVPQNLLLLHRAMQYAGPLGLRFAIKGDVPQLTDKATAHPSTTAYKLGLSGASSCAEEIGIEAIIRLAVDTGNGLHVQTVSTRGGVDIIRRWRQQGASVTAEVALHHLLFTHENIGEYDTTFKTCPPLRTEEDRVALLEALNDGTIDCIVSDHTPCTAFEKDQDFVSAPAGMSMLDTFLPALYHHLVLPGKMNWQTLVRVCTQTPRQMLGLDDVQLQVGGRANFVLFDPSGCTQVTPESLCSKGKNSPFLGTTLQGAVYMVCVGENAVEFRFR